MKKMSQIVGIFMLGAITSFAMNVAAEAVISSGSVSYGNTTVNTALDELFSAVDINEKIGTTDISNIGNGTITGAISGLNSIDILVNRYSVTNIGVAENVDCNWSDYSLLLIVYNYYGNFLETQIVPTDWFKNTSEGYRVQMNSQEISVYQNGEKSINIINAQKSPYSVSVYGLMKNN